MIVKSKMWLGREASWRLRRGSSVLLVRRLLLTDWLFVMVLGVFVWLLFGFWLIVLIDCVCKRRRRTEKCLKLSHRETENHVGSLWGWEALVEVEWNLISWFLLNHEMEITNSTHNSDTGDILPFSRKAWKACRMSCNLLGVKVKWIFW